MTTEQDIAVEARHQLLEATEAGHRIELAFQEMVCRCVEQDKKECACDAEEEERIQNLGYPALSQTELKVLRHVALGHSNEDAARACGIKANTVKTHMRHIFISLKASDRAHAVALGFRYGFLSHEMLWPEEHTEVGPPIDVDRKSRRVTDTREDYQDGRD